MFIAVFLGLTAVPAHGAISRITGLRQKAPEFPDPAFKSMIQAMLETDVIKSEDLNLLYADTSDELFTDIVEYNELEDYDIDKMLLVAWGRIARNYEEFSAIADNMEDSRTPVKFDMRNIAPFRDVQLLMFYNCALNDAEALSELPNLLAIDITECRVTDAAMFYDFPHLKHLSIETSTITYEAPYIPSSDESGLEWVYYYANEGMMSPPHLSMLKNAELIGLVNCEVFSLDQFKELTGLKVLYLWGNSIMSLEPLREHTSLEFLDVSYNLVNDITPLTGLENLYYLDIESNNIKETDYNRLKEALPACEINWDE
jgi:hypothetical protein